MRKMSIVVMALCAIGLSACATAQATSGTNTGSGNLQQTPNVGGPTVDVGVSLNFRDWYPWGGIQASPNGNTVTFNGRVSTAGYVSERLDKAQKNRRVLLEIRNATASSYSRDRLMKITVNKDDQVVRPIGITDLIEDEYIPSNFQSVEFVLPLNFDGKLGFVFYQADLKNLQITATYK